jgi:hypothetical protein
LRRPGKHPQRHAKRNYPEDPKRDCPPSANRPPLAPQRPRRSEGNYYADRKRSLSVNDAFPGHLIEYLSGVSIHVLFFRLP